jgi:hypothetical protein
VRNAGQSRRLSVWVYSSVLRSPRAVSGRRTWDRRRGGGEGEEEEEEERINDGEKPKTTAAEGGGPRQDRESKRECYKIGREIGRQGYIRWDGRGRGRGGGGGRGRGGEGRRLWLLRNYCI